jgi:hypothetical protein
MLSTFLIRPAWEYYLSSGTRYGCISIIELIAIVVGQINGVIGETFDGHVYGVVDALSVNIRYACQHSEQRDPWYQIKKVLHLSFQFSILNPRQK